MNASHSEFSRHNNQRGLTLLEVLVSIIIGAIMGALLVQFMGTSVIQSAKPVIRFQQHLSLNQIVENISADYKKLLAEDSTPLATLKGNIDSGNYGSYTSSTAYILFSGGNEVPDGGGTNRLLKVTLSKGDHTVVTLFTK